jgi:type I restriction enzyme S subunit
MTELLPVMPRYETYKDSGMAWIGEIPKSWVLIRGSYIFKIINKRSKNGNEALLTVSEHHGVKLRAESNVNMFMAESYVGYKICYPGDLVINSLWAWSRGLGFSNIHGIVSTAYSVFRPDTFKYDKSFLNYLLRTKKYVDQYFIASKGIWISRLQLSDSAFLKIPILSPPISEQTTIAKFLDCKTAKIDQAVAIKEEQIRLLKERKQILIQTAVTKGLDPNVPMADSGVEWIGQIPAHWNIVANRTLFKERVEPGQDDLPLLSVSIHSGISDDEVSEEENIRGRVKIEDKTKYNLVKPNDIVFNMMRAWQGAIGAAKVTGMVSPAYIIAKPKETLHAPYFEYQYRCPIFIQQMDRFSKGITDFRKRLYWHEFKQLLTILPPIGEQKVIVNHILTQSAKIDLAIAIQAQMIEKLKE